MSSEGRRWRCPLCGREYQIPMSVDDPMACPRCMGQESGPLEPAGTSSAAAQQNATGSSSVVTGAADLVALATLESPLADPSTAEVPHEPSVLERWSGQTAGPVPDRSAGRTATRRKRRFVVAAVIVASFVAVFATLASLRPFPLADIFLAPPTLRANPYEAAPLAALVEFNTRMPAGATVEISDGEREWTYKPAHTGTTSHRLAVIGLRPDREHTIHIEATSAGGWFVERSDPLTIRTPPLPEDFPPLRTVISKPDKMEPGVTLFAVNRWLDGKRSYDYGYYIMLDAKGEVVWYYRSGRGTADLRVLPNGNLLCNQSNYRQAYEVDLLGRIVQEWHVTGTPGPVSPGSYPVETDSFHHELAELPSGELMAVGTELRHIESFPSSETDPAAEPGPADVVGDELIVFQRNGEVTHRYSMFDLLDTNRIGYGSLGNFWKSHYDFHEEGVVSRDWSHVNGAFYDPRDDSFVISVRHQDCLVKVDRESGRLKWILGNHENWAERWQKYLLKPVGDLEWPYHQHGPQLTPQGTIIMYDNGNYRATPPKFPMPPASSYSRVVEFRVDEENMTVEQVWEYRGEEGETFFSTFYCEADRQPTTGNVLVTDGGHIEDEEGVPSNLIPSAHQWARLFELTPGDKPEKIFEVVIDSGLGSNLGWSVYRSDRLPGVDDLSEIATATIAAAPLPDSVEEVAPPPAVTPDEAETTEQPSDTTAEPPGDVPQAEGRISEPATATESVEAD